MKSVLILMLMVLTVSAFAQQNDVGEAKQAKADFIKTDAGISKYFSSAYGYAIFPGIGKGGLGIGGAGGKGTVFRGGAPVGDCKMSQVTIGFQAGGQKYAEVIFFENAKAYERFVGNKFEFAAQVSAVALKAGVSADAEYRDGMLVFTQAIGGLMYEASVGGQKFKTEIY
jgi:lipid-binding SYLF domain-containing protein